MFKKRKQDTKLFQDRYKGLRPLHPTNGNLDRGPFPVKSHEAKKILKRFTKKS